MVWFPNLLYAHKSISYNPMCYPSNLKDIRACARHKFYTHTHSYKNGACKQTFELTKLLTYNHVSFHVVRLKINRFFRLLFNSDKDKYAESLRVAY